MIEWKENPKIVMDKAVSLKQRIVNLFKRLWKSNLPPEPIIRAKSAGIEPPTPQPTRQQTEEIMSRAPKIPPTYRPMEQIPKLKNELIRRQVPELNKKRNRESTYANAKHFKRRQPTTARKLWNPRARPEEEE